MDFTDFDSNLEIKIKEISLSKLLPHEKVNLNEVNDIINKSKSIKNYKIPLIIACNKTNMIIDGHHRFKALNILGYEKVPVINLNYFSEFICCSLTKKISKTDLINFATNKNVRNIKYSNHHIYDNKNSTWVKIEYISNKNFMHIRETKN